MIIDEDWQHTGYGFNSSLGPKAKAAHAFTVNVQLQSGELSDSLDPICMHGL